MPRTAFSATPGWWSWCRCAGTTRWSVSRSTRSQSRYRRVSIVPGTIDVPTTSALGGGGNLTDCSGKSGAALDLCEWGNMLDGAAEASVGSCSVSNGANCIGAMIGARGCVGYDATTEFTDSTGATIAGTGIYTISVAWLGLIATVSPPAALTCGQNQYASEAQRRVVTSQIRIAALGAL